MNQNYHFSEVNDDQSLAYPISDKGKSIAPSKNI